MLIGRFSGTFWNGGRMATFRKRVSRTRTFFRVLLLERLELRTVFSANSVLDVGPYGSPLNYDMSDEFGGSDGLVASQVFSSNAERFDLSSDRVWELRPRVPATQGLQSFIQASSYSTAVLNLEELSSVLSRTPEEYLSDTDGDDTIVTLPTPDSGFARFSIVQSSIMEPALAALFPEIRTYRGQGIDDPAATLRFDVTPAGFHAQVLSPSGAFYVDPYWHLDTSVYVSYFKSQLSPRADARFTEKGLSEGHEATHSSLETTLNSIDSKYSLLASGSQNLEDESWNANELVSMNKSAGGIELARSGTQLRTYRLATAATGEYTAFHGGTVALGQAAIVTAVNRVTGIYENELAIRLVLVGNNSSLVYTNAATDPYTNNDGTAMLGQNQANIDSRIGNANYDIGHVFSTGGGGIAGFGVVGVSGSKAEGVTGSTSPNGDPFFVDYVAHEMGHQFGGSHTFNSELGSCGAGNRDPQAAYEPGSGSTIQAYAGICGSDNLQPNSDPYFHSFSFDEIVVYTSTGAGNAAAVKTNTGNNVPRVKAGADYAIPARTPFILSGAGTDSDSADALTYNWEQRDLGAAQSLNAPDNGASPIFRSFSPTLIPERTFPRLSNLLANTTAIGEKLPTTTRTLNFRATVRDNRSGGGGVNTDDMQVSVVDTGAGFAITSPNTAISWAGNSTQTVTWNVAGTTASPINTANVNIWLSTNGGTTFPILLAANTPNDGTQSITVPNLATTNARIKVEAANSIYFDVSNTNFTITGGTNTAPTITEVLNRIVNAGASTGSIPFTIGDAQTAAASLTVTAISSNAALVAPSGIVLGGSGANRTISITPASGVSGQAKISISVSDGSLTVQEFFELFIEEVIVCAAYQDFDSVAVPLLPANWTSVATVGSTNWVTSSASSSTAPNNVFVPNPSSVGDSRLTSPTFAVTSANRQLRFKNSFNLESTYDGGVLEISINGGAFSDIVSAGGTFRAGGYTGTIDSRYSNPLANRQAWTGDSSGYIDTIVDLPAAAIGSTVQLRWRMGSDSSDNAVGWRVDAVQACGAQALATPTLTITSGNAVYNNAAYVPSASITGNNTPLPTLSFVFYSDAAGTSVIAAPENVGTYFVRAFSAANVGNNAAQSAITTFNVTPFALTASGTAANKVYDALNGASVTVSLAGVFAGDTVTGSASGSFADKNVANGKTVTIGTITLAGADAGNYTVGSAGTTTANVTPAALVASVTANNKPFDNTTVATIASRSLGGILGTDVVTVSGGSATFADIGVGNNKTVTATGLTIGGTDAGNYTVNATATTLANITATVFNRQVFYKGSSFASQAGGTLANPNVPAALDSLKVLAQSSNVAQTLNFANNVVNTAQGINGVILDIAGLVGASLIPSDFGFRVSPTGAFNEASNLPKDWATGPNPSLITVMTPGTATTPARVRIEWNNNQIENRWLQIRVLPTANTGLPSQQTFYLGHLLGEVNGLAVGGASGSLQVTNADINVVRPLIGTNALVTSAADITKNGLVQNSDITQIRSGVGVRQLRLITIPVSGSGGEGTGNGGGNGGSGGDTVPGPAPEVGAPIVSPTVSVLGGSLGAVVEGLVRGGEKQSSSASLSQPVVAVGTIQSSSNVVTAIDSAIRSTSKKVDEVVDNLFAGLANDELGKFFQ